MISSIAKSLCIAALFGGCALMAQSLAPSMSQSLAPSSIQNLAPSLTEDLDSLPKNHAADLDSSVNGSVESFSNSALSAAVSASAESEWNAVLPEQAQYTREIRKSTFFDRSTPSASSSYLRTSGAIAVGSGIRENRGYKSGGLLAIPRALRKAENGNQIYGSKTQLQDCKRQSVKKTGNGADAKQAACELEARRAEKTEDSQVAVAEETTDLDKATYSGDFPDSTRGTALASPPDSGTEDSLAWNPSFAPRIDDLSQEEFLHPTLYPRGRREGKRRQMRGIRGSNLRRPAAIRSSDALNPQIGGELKNSLNPGISDQPALSSDPLAALNQQLNPDNSQ